MNFSGVFKYDPKLGLLYRDGVPVTGVQEFAGKSYTAERICFAMYHGYLPAYVCRWQNNTYCYPIGDLYDPSAHADPKSPLSVHAVRGKYPGVRSVSTYRKGKKYQGVYQGRKTDVVDSAEAAFRLLLTLKAQVESTVRRKRKTK